MSVSKRNSGARAITTLRSTWSRVKVHSCADGTMYVKPTWRRKYAKPGVLTRMYLAWSLQAFMNGRLSK